MTFVDTEKKAATAVVYAITEHESIRRQYLRAYHQIKSGSYNFLDFRFVVDAAAPVY